MTGQNEKGAVTRAERILYGGAAPLVRKLGQAVTNVDAAVEELAASLRELHEADQVVMGRTTPPDDFNERGESPYTVWINSVFERVWELRAATGSTYSDIAGEALAREQVLRKEIHSLPIGEPTIGSVGLTTAPEPSAATV